MTVLAFLAAFLLIPVMLFLSQPLWCKCGELVPWSWQVMSSHTSQHLIDAYTFSHVLHGLIFYFFLTQLAAKKSFGLRFLIATCIEIAWELLENSPIVIERYRSATASLDYFGDSALNSFSDILSCMLGFYFSAKVSVRMSVAFFILVELLMLATIKDNLTLNVLMLLYPIPAIKQWQLS